MYMKNCGGVLMIMILLGIIISYTLYKSNSSNISQYFGKVGTESPKQDFSDDNSVLSYLRKYGNVDRIPSASELKDSSTEQLIAIFHSYLDNTDYVCHRKLRMGNLGDGGWEICDDYEFRPIKPCVIYSFGMNTKTHKRSDQVYFFQVGIRGEDDHLAKSKNWNMTTFSDVRKMLNTTQKFTDVVKMDVEDSEWDTLTLMAKEGQFANVRQLLVEYHFGGNNADRQALELRLGVLRAVEEQGFRRFYVHKNPACPRKLNAFPVIRTVCYEIHYVNINFKRTPLF